MTMTEAKKTDVKGDEAAKTDEPNVQPDPAAPIVESDSDRLLRLAQEAARAPMAPSVLSGTPPMV
jgi:hypothetical protein